MQFEWDETKRLTNLEKHGFDFAVATQVFDGRQAIHIPSKYPDEERFMTIAVVNDVPVAVVWTWRTQVIRLISVRHARTKEIRMLQEFAE